MQCKVSFIYHYSQSLNDLNFSWRSRSKWTQAYLHLKLPMLGGSWCFSNLGLAPVFCNDSGRWEYRPSHFSLASSEIWIPRFSPGGAGTKTSFPLPNIRKLFFFFFFFPARHTPAIQPHTEPAVFMQDSGLCLITKARAVSSNNKQRRFHTFCPSCIQIPKHTSVIQHQEKDNNQTSGALS